MMNSIPQENELQSMNHWVPATPNRALSTNGNSVPLQFQGTNLETENWQQLLDFPDDRSLGSMSCYQPVQDLDPHRQGGRYGGQIINPNSFMALLGANSAYGLGNVNFNKSQGIYQVPIGDPIMHGTFSKGIGTLLESSSKNPMLVATQFVAQNRNFHPVNRPLIPNLNAQTSVNWVDDNSSSLRLMEKNHTFMSSSCNAPKGVFQVPEDQNLVPRRPEYNLNLPASLDTEAMFDQPDNLFPNLLATPNQASQFQEMLDFSAADTIVCLGGDKQNISAENGRKQGTELLLDIVDTSSCVSPTPKKIVSNEKEMDQVIDLNKTPQHKTQKRKKIRPKVIREGKLKRAPKSENPKTPKPSDKPKRKYTRKSSVKISETEPSKAKAVDENSYAVPSAKSCRRALSFEQESIAEIREEDSSAELQEMQHVAERDFNLNNQLTGLSATENNIFQMESVVDVGRQTEFPPFIREAKMINDLAQSVAQGTNNDMPQAVRPPPTRTTTFHDLLMGNFNCAQHIADARNGNLEGQGNNLYPTQSYVPGAQSVNHRQMEKKTLHQHTGTTSNSNHSLPQQPPNCVPRVARQPPTQATTFQELLLGNGNRAGSTVEDPHILNANQQNWRSDCNPVQRHTRADNTRQLSVQAESSFDTLVDCGEMILHRCTQPLMITTDVQNETRISKREHDLISEQQHSSISSREIMPLQGHNSAYARQQEFPDREKKRRTETVPCSDISTIQCSRAAGISLDQVQASRGKNTNANTRSSQFNPYPWDSYAGNVSHLAEANRGDKVQNRLSTSTAYFHQFSKQPMSSELSYEPQLSNKGNLALPSSHSLQSLSVPIRTPSSKDKRTTQSTSGTTITKQYSRPTASGLLVTTIKTASLSDARQVIRGPLTNGSSRKDDASSSIGNRKEVMERSLSYSKRRGQLRKQDIRDLIDGIIGQLKGLKLDSVSEDMTMQPENAIVRYKGDGAVVMYQVKKRKPRPKVHLDLESERVWKLLMGKADKESEEGTDEKKEEWWAKEREVFRGRAKAFIGRMHLIQGDRRFSLWKGSVVDSVIGVFLTQNVSDHLSSSAFISLAARFPLSLASSRTSCTFEEGLTREEPEICIIDLEDTIQNNRSDQVLSSANSMPSLGYGNILPSGTEIVNTVDGAVRGAIEETLSLDSFDSSVCLTNGGSCSGSNSEVEDQFSTDNPLIGFDQNKDAEISQGTPRINRLEHTLSSLHIPQTNVARNARVPTVPSTNYQLSCDTPESSSITSDVKSQNRNISDHIGLQPNIHEQQGSHLVHQEGIITPAVEKETSLHSCNDHRHESLTLESEKTPTTKMVTEPHSNEQGHSGVAHKNIKGSSPKTRKGKQDADNRTVDWDLLRKEAQHNRSRPRKKDGLDSMDYETMRHAEVKEISDAIKERGMNNMLAERIKAFLNRIVKDHGSIDLEWLRDAPPDKAKDYLLSIRGLGLKSVECVRLLTLHHLAFPVDTNVGRIAVRLGWVPLQPLPESLQLHLLEMYPVLETIQKYLWPRLCKLDQEELYELHYQMITFGKVFCTKSKPNCSACPMRAECKHFASAFASARLALPGPEEKNIAPLNVPVAADGAPTMNIPSQSFPQWNNHILGIERPVKATCEPIIEEPTTPEQECVERSEIDIEDSFGEDPDDIPTIRIDFHGYFPQNLQNIMEENNLDVQGDDMSKALVALTEEAASLQPQKLKNVSRLRTEHQVYELPDEHPLLKEMDKREPDDPSPYLLAIWTPGETPNSIQPPESQCQSGDSSKLCNEKTCFSCNSRREADSNIVRGTLLIPCRTAMRGSFPLNGTYFQVNEMFADHDSSLNPIDVPRELVWNLPRRTVYFGTSVSTIFKGLTTAKIQYCFWRGFVCVRGFDQRYRAPRPLLARLHQPASKLVKKPNQEKT